MRLLVTIILSFLIALLLEIVPFPDWMVWLNPEWVALVLIFWTLTLPHRIGVVVAFLMGLLMDLLMGTLLGEHAAVFVTIVYFVSRFHIRIRFFPMWQQSALIFILILLCQTFLSWVSGLLGGFRADSWFWLPAVSSALIWPWINTLLKSCVKQGRLYTSRL